MKTDAQITREQRRMSLLRILSSRKSREYRQGVLQFAVLCAVIDQDEWGRLFHKVRCRQQKFTEEDFE